MATRPAPAGPRVTPWECGLVDPVTIWEPGKVHAHDHIELNLVSAGSITYLLGGRAVTVAGPGQGVFWATHPHAIIATAPATRMTYVHLPLAQVLGWDLPGEARRTLLAGQALHLSTDGAESDRELDRDAARWCRDLQAGGWTRQAAELELRARLLRILAEGQPPDASREGRTATAIPAATSAKAPRKTRDPVPPAGATQPPFPAPGATGAPARPNPTAPPTRTSAGPEVIAAALRLAAVIEARWQEPLAVADLARNAGLGPSRAMEVFKAATGTTLQAHLRRYRIAQACHRLVTGDDPATTIALACGFGTFSAFYDAFAKATGTTPLEYRRRVRG